VYRDRGLTPGCAAFDQRKRARCAGCRSGVRAVRGHAVLVAWRGDGLAVACCRAAVLAITVELL
jgi:hypothetical protein